MITIRFDALVTIVAIMLFLNTFGMIAMQLLALPGVGVSTSFTGRETIPDGTVVKPGQKIMKMWECRVDASSTAIKDAYVKVVPNVWNLGKPGLKGPVKPVLIVDTKDGVDPGRTFRVEVQITVPKDLKDGIYELDVRLCDKQGNVYNSSKKPLYALLQVSRK